MRGVGKGLWGRVQAGVCVRGCGWRVIGARWGTAGVMEWHEGGFEALSTLLPDGLSLWIPCWKCAERNAAHILWEWMFRLAAALGHS